MEQKIPLARKEGERSAVLLSGTGTGEVGKGALCRDKRKKNSSHTKGDEGEAQVNPVPKRKSDAKVKGGRRGHKLQRGRDSTSGAAVGTSEGADSSIRRSAKELGIEWPEDECAFSPGHAHYFQGKTYVDIGQIFRCFYCGQVKWLPVGCESGQVLTTLMRIYGVEGGYQRMLDSHPEAKRLLCHIKDIGYLNRALPPNLVPIAVSSMVMDRQYPYDVEPTEEVML